MYRGLLVLTLLLVPRFAPAAWDYDRDVRPILADNCFHCHGPDAAKRASGLRLDVAESAMKKRSSGPAITPGNPGESELVRRILSPDADEKMPPPDSHRKLTPAQIKMLSEWVAQGAKYEPHWAFRPLPKSVPVPEAGGGWARTRVDRFVAARLNTEKLTPSPEAAPEAWLRRVSFDLTGLPPTPAELSDFVKNHAETDYEKAVDRLLASPRYGERMASPWLDLARYADTHGYQMDRERPTWPYRDWVIGAFNTNRPYDQFLTEQLAGDLLPGASKSQKLATAFNRLHMQNEEGGIVQEEFRVAYVADRVQTFGTAALGLTLDCARCHDHKFDPLKQSEYYALFALFQNIDEAGQTPYFVNSTPTPALILSTDTQEQKLAELRATVAAKEAELARARASAQVAARWLARLTTPPTTVPDVTHYSFDGAKTGPKLNRIGDPATVPGKVGDGVKLTGDNGFSFPDSLPVGRSDPFGFALWLNPDATPEHCVVLHKSKAPVDAGNRGFDLQLEDGKPAFGLYHMWPGDAVKVRAKVTIPVGKWSHIAATSDGSGLASGLNIYINGKRVETEVVRDHLVKDILYANAPDRVSNNGEPPLTLGERFRDIGYQGIADELTVATRAFTAAEVALLAGQTLPEHDPAWVAHCTESIPTVIAARDALRNARRELSACAEPIAQIMVMEELATPKPARLLKRGAYDSPGETVTPGTPGFLPPLPADAPRNRLALARWLFTPDHPLTARVAVNRLWQQLFGGGLAETLDNFGTTGSPPTHPELLDWLARDYVDRGWDTKSLLKSLVLSATYRQSTHTSAALRERDPANKLLARMSARRLTAEMLRDQSLALSALLTERVGGPSVYPYQPAGLWDEVMGKPRYPTSTSDNLYRRSVYTYIKRTAPHPQLTTLDVPNREVCTALRQATSTPLQALLLLNDPQQIEAARYFAVRALREAPDAPARLAWLFRAATGRASNAGELAALSKFHDAERKRFAADAKAAGAFMGVGATPLPAGVPAVEVAPLASVALMILNHADTVYRR